MKPADQITSVSSAALELVKMGVLWGTAAALGGALFGFYLLPVHRSVGGLLRGINGASFALAVLAGTFVMGAGKVRETDVHNMVRRLDQGPAAPTNYPWGSVLTALVASAFCALIWWGAGVLIR